MAIAVVQNKAAPTAFNGGASSVVFDSAPTVDNYLVFVFHSTSSAIPDPPAGLTEAFAVDDAGRPTVLYYRKVQSGDGTTWDFLTDNLTTATNEAHGYEVSGLDPTSPLDKTAGGVAGTYTSMQVGGTGVLSQADEIVFGACGLGGTAGGSETITSPTMTVDGAATHPRTIPGYLIVSDTASIDPLFSWTTSRRANAMLVSFKGASAPAGDDGGWYRFDGSLWQPMDAIRL